MTVVFLTYTTKLAVSAQVLVGLAGTARRIASDLGDADILTPVGTGVACSLCAHMLITARHEANDTIVVHTCAETASFWRPRAPDMLRLVRNFG